MYIAIVLNVQFIYHAEQLNEIGGSDSKLQRIFVFQICAYL